MDPFRIQHFEECAYLMRVENLEWRGGEGPFKSPEAPISLEQRLQTSFGGKNHQVKDNRAGSLLESGPTRARFPSERQAGKFVNRHHNF